MFSEKVGTGPTFLQFSLTNHIGKIFFRFMRTNLSSGKWALVLVMGESIEI
jgi:hypothetical protein